MLKVLTALSLLALAIGLAGCAALQPGAQHEAVLELGIKAATARVLHEKPAWKPTVLRLSAEAEQFLGQDNETTLGALESFVVARIPWDRLMPEEEELARLALRAIRQETENYLKGQGIEEPAELRVAALRVLGWVREVAARAA